MKYEKIITIIENELERADENGLQSDFTASIGEDSMSAWVCFDGYSPAGENIVVELQYPLEEFPALTVLDISKDVYREWENFDKDEHVMLWADSRGTNGVPETIRELMDDAEEIENMLRDLNSRMERAAAVERGTK